MAQSVHIIGLQQPQKIQIHQNNKLLRISTEMSGQQLVETGKDLCLKGTNIWASTRINWWLPIKDPRMFWSFNHSKWACKPLVLNREGSFIQAQHRMQLAKVLTLTTVAISKRLLQPPSLKTSSKQQPL